ncbi:MAG: hypothetical protein ABI707_08660 [Ferruginibacter sp.]
MKNIIATWICIDDKTNGTYFPSAKGNSADHSVQDIYWRCICTFFWSARFHHPVADLALFSNQDQMPDIENVYLGEVLKKLGVKIYVTPFEYITPAGYYGEWRNQFYEFSIFNFICNHKDFDDEDGFLLLDSDCIITKSLSPLFKCLQEQSCITYRIDYDVDHNINGNSRKEMKAIFEELSSIKLDDFPAYHGGEFYASTIQIIKKLVPDFKIVWQQLLTRHSAGLQKLNEEAHVLSYLFFKNGIEGGQANDYVKRLWTDPTTFRNVEQKDMHLSIWHLPAEKRKGFKKFFLWLKNINFILDTTNNETFQRRIQKTFLVPGIPIRHKPYYTAKFFVKKVFGY